MAHSVGVFKFKDGKHRFFEFNECSDVCISRHYKTEAEVLKHWRSEQRNHCTCGHEEEVIAWVSYGVYFKAHACRRCHSLWGMPDELNTLDPFYGNEAYNETWGPELLKDQ